MNPKTRKAKPKISKAKIALVAVLAVAMAAVWGRALLPSGKTPKPSASRQARKSTPVAPATASKPNTVIASPTKDWPTVPLTTAVLNDPFAKPAWAIPPKPDAPEQHAAVAAASTLREELQQAGVSLVMISGDSKVAVVGDREVRVGDSIQGFRVVDITPGGIVLADAATPAPPVGANGTPGANSAPDFSSTKPPPL